MNLSIDPDEEFIRCDHPVSAIVSAVSPQIGKLNCVVLIWLSIGEQRADWSSLSVATTNLLI